MRKFIRYIYIIKTRIQNKYLRMNKYRTTDEYIAQFEGSVRERLEEIRRIIALTAPGSTETISYNMPAFKTDKVLVYFAAAAKHLGFYPTGEGIEAFREELEDKGLRFSKGALQLPYSQPLPEDLIRRMVQHRLKAVR